MGKKRRPQILIRLLASILAAGAATGLSAQGIDEFTISGDEAIAARSTTEISVATAEQVAKECVAWAGERDRRVSVVILGLGGNLVYAYRMDGQNPVNIDTAQMKAESALYFRVSSNAAKRRYADTTSLSQRIMIEKYLVEGGLPIIVDQQMIGAIGVGGYYQNDQRCAHHALTTVIGPQPPLVED